MAKTTIILGAGASVDYGLPIGKELRTALLQPQMADRIAQIADSLSLEEASHFGWTEGGSLRRHSVRSRFLEFQRSLGAAAMGSIDAFLTAWQEFETIGTLGITQILLQHELNAIQSADLLIGCYPTIADAIQRELAMGTSEVTLITFNYERTLESIVANILSERSPVSEADEILKSMLNRVTHIYGRFSTPLRFCKSSKRFRIQNRGNDEQSLAMSEREFASSSKDILVVGSRRQAENLPQPESNRSKIAESDRVVFLGFGFDKQNLSRLGLDQGWPARPQGAKYFATAMWLPNKQKIAVQQQLPGIELRDCDASQLLYDIEL